MLYSLHGSPRKGSSCAGHGGSQRAWGQVASRRAAWDGTDTWTARVGVAKATWCSQDIQRCHGQPGKAQAWHKQQAQAKACSWFQGRAASTVRCDMAACDMVQRRRYPCACSPHNAGPEQPQRIQPWLGLGLADGRLGALEQGPNVHAAGSERRRHGRVAGGRRRRPGCRGAACPIARELATSRLHHCAGQGREPLACASVLSGGALPQTGHARPSRPCESAAYGCRVAVFCPLAKRLFH